MTSPTPRTSTMKLSIRARRVLTELVTETAPYPAWQLAWETARQHNAWVSDKCAAEYFEAVQELAHDTDLAEWVDSTRSGNEDAVRVTAAGIEFARTIPRINR